MTATCGSSSAETQVTVVEVDFYVEDLWWFPTATDMDITAYPRQMFVYADGAPGNEGTFQWEISQGFQKVVINSIEGHIASVTKTNDNSVQIVSVNYSDNPEDIILTLTYTTPDKKLTCSLEKSVSVRTFRLALLWNKLRREALSNGWLTYIEMKGVDQWEQDLPFYQTSSSNEDFSNFETLYEGKNWVWPIPNGGNNLMWADYVTMPDPYGLLYPKPVSPNDSEASVPVDSACQTWRYGSSTPGQGDVFLKGNLSLQRNRGFAEHTQPGDTQ